MRRDGAAVTVLLAISAVLLLASLGAPVWGDHTKNGKLDIYWTKARVTIGSTSHDFNLDCSGIIPGFLCSSDFSSASKGSLSLLTIAAIITAVAAAFSLFGLVSHKLGRLVNICRIGGAIAAAVLAYIAVITYFAAFRKHISEDFAGHKDNETYGPIGWAVALTAAILLTISALVSLTSGRHHGYTKV